MTKIERAFHVQAWSVCILLICSNLLLHINKCAYMSSVHKLEANTLRMQQFQVKQKKQTHSQ